MESFFSTVKSELGEPFDSNGETKMQLFDYIEVFLQPMAPAFGGRPYESSRIRTQDVSSRVPKPKLDQPQRHVNASDC